MKISQLIPLFFSIVLAGCATGPIHYPDLPGPVTLAPSSEVRTSTITAGDYQIGNSQVFVGGASDLTNNGANAMFGAVGVLLAIKVDERNNAAAVGDYAQKLGLNFEQALQEKLQAHVAQMPEGQRYMVSATNSPAPNIVVAPLARLVIASDNLARLDFQLTTFFKTSAGNDKRKVYEYYSPTRLSFAQWSESQAAPVQQAVGHALDQIVPVLFQDIRGQLADPFEPGRPTIQWSQKNTPFPTSLTSVVLQETANQFVLAPKITGYIMPWSVVIVDKSRIERQ
jgi:hypothetical protein